MALKDGVPGTAMPPWEAQLSDAQREAVVATYNKSKALGGAQDSK